MTEPLPPPPPETPIAWVEVIADEVVAVRMCPLGDFALQTPIAGASQVPITLTERNNVAQNMRAWCVSGGAVVPRVASDIAIDVAEIDADGVDEAVISDIPEGARLRLSGAATAPWTTITDGTAAITCSVPGTIYVQILCPAPFLDWRGVVNAV